MPPSCNQGPVFYSGGWWTRNEVASEVTALVISAVAPKLHASDLVPTATISAQGYFVLFVVFFRAAYCSTSRVAHRFAGGHVTISSLGASSVGSQMWHLVFAGVSLSG